MRGGEPDSKPLGREERLYRFPYSRVAVEPVADISGTFLTRLVWQKGKATVPLFESTALRPIAQVRLRGQNFPVFLSQHSRKRRDRILLAGKRKTARSLRCALRFIAIIEGRDDRLTWTWRIGATAAALAIGASPDDEKSGDEVALYLPLSPGRAQMFSQADLPDLLGVWINDLAVTLRATPAQGVREGASSLPRLVGDGKGVTLTLADADLSGHGVTMGWETWVSPARTQAEVLAALYRHAAEANDQAQEPQPLPAGLLLQIGEESEAALTASTVPIAKRGVERLAYKERGADGVERQTVGVGADTAQLCVAILGRYYQSGDDALRRKARLLSYGVTDFQVALEESPHWGAVWDAQQQVGKTKQYVDVRGGKTLSVATAARAALGLFVAFEHFKIELLQRSALSASQWLLLKLDRNGRIAAERFSEEGPPESEGPSSLWSACEALLPLIKTFQVTQNEAFLKAALRIVATLREGLTSGLLRFEYAPIACLCAAIEGALEISHEYENAEMIALAGQLSVGLRARRERDGFITPPPDLAPLPSQTAPTLTAARAALALARGETEPYWLTFALRAVRAARQRLAGKESEAHLSDWGMLAQTSLGVLLGVAARARNCVPDNDRVTITRKWQTFAPDPATRTFIRVTAPDGSPVDYLALVCPISLQVLIAVLAPPTIGEVIIEKNQRQPFVKNLLNGEMELKALLVPLGDGREANIGVFQADT